MGEKRTLNMSLHSLKALFLFFFKKSTLYYFCHNIQWVEECWGCKQRLDHTMQTNKKEGEMSKLFSSMTLWSLLFTKAWQSSEAFCQILKLCCDDVRNAGGLVGVKIRVGDPAGDRSCPWKLAHCRHAFNFSFVLHDQVFTIVFCCDL